MYTGYIILNTEQTFKCPKSIRRANGTAFSNTENALYYGTFDHPSDGAITLMRIPRCNQ